MLRHKENPCVDAVVYKLRLQGDSPLTHIPTVRVEMVKLASRVLRAGLNLAPATIQTSIRFGT